MENAQIEWKRLEQYIGKHIVNQTTKIYISFNFFLKTAIELAVGLVCAWNLRNWVMCNGCVSKYCIEGIPIRTCKNTNKTVDNREIEMLVSSGSVGDWCMALCKE